MLKRLIGGHEGDVFDFSLCREHSVKRVAMRIAQRSGMAGMLKADRQRSKLEIDMMPVKLFASAAASGHLPR
jgi:hypothetical protein